MGCILTNMNDTATTMNCDQCLDTETIDRAGAEIACPYCVAIYKPSSVTMVTEIRKDTGQRVYKVIDCSQLVGGYVYYASTNYDDATHRLTKRRAVIKAALTRRANKAAAR
jgi:hypothetical protein